jgi:hypothetical protein
LSATKEIMSRRSSVGKTERMEGWLKVVWRSFAAWRKKSGDKEKTGQRRLQLAGNMRR